MWRLSVGFLVFTFACKSSGSEPIDPLAEAYCADCCRTLQDGGLVPCPSTTGCERVINDTLKAGCPDQTRKYYECLTQNSCDTTACTAEWATREECMMPEPIDGGTGGSGGGSGGAGGGAGA